MAVLDEWLRSPDEAAFQQNLGPLKERLQHIGGHFERFVTVARCTHPLFPLCLDGPIEGVVTRLIEAFDSLKPSNQMSTDVRTALEGAGIYLQFLFRKEHTDLIQSTLEEEMFGTQYFERTIPTAPASLKIPHKVKWLVELRVQAYAVLVEITHMLAWAGLELHVANIPHAPSVPYLERKKGAGYLSIHSPNRRSVAELASFGFFFRAARTEKKGGIPAFHPPMIPCAESLPTADSGDQAPPIPNVSNHEGSAHPHPLFSQEWFYGLSGAAKPEGDSAQKGSLAFAASRMLEYRRIGKKVGSLQSLFNF